MALEIYFAFSFDKFKFSMLQLSSILLGRLGLLEQRKQVPFVPETLLKS